MGAIAVQLHGVSYKYPHSDKVALTEVSYSFARGATAIVGPNGAGKSTLVKLLTGLLTPTSGQISVQLPGRVYLPPEALPKAVLFQEPAHLYLTIRQNITMRFERVPGEDTLIYDALGKAGLGKVVKGLAEGIDTLVGAGFGGQTDLSGGQWQRLALARLIYQDAPMIILDEPVASLDPQGERAVFELFARLAPSKIIIFTTHRYDSIPKNTKIVVLVDGVISESGTHEELLHHQRDYWSLYTSEASNKAVPVLADQPEQGRIYTMNDQTNPDREEFALPPRSRSLKISSTLNLVPQLVTSVSNGHRDPAPASPAFKDPALAHSTPNLPSTIPASPPPVPASSQTPASAKRNGGPSKTKKRIAFLFIFLLLLAATIPGALFVLARGNTKPAASINPIVGHAFFISSGQISEHNNQGINDELLIELQNIPNPAPGNSYYAWLLGDAAKVLAPPILLGKLPVSNGQVHYLYKGDGQHTNLMAISSRFLITEENADTLPSNPSPDKSIWRYYAQLPQTPDSMDMMHEGALQHLRHMLADAPELMQVNLPGGLDIWLFRNTQKVAEWAGGARDFWENKNAAGVRNHVIRILDYLDGEVYVQQDVPPGTPNLVNPRIAPLALLEFDQMKQSPPGLLYLLGIHLGAMVQAPGISHENQVLAAQIDQDSNNVQFLLQQVRKDAKLLVTMNDAHLLSNGALALLDDMETAANYAYIGQIDPNTNTVQGGVIQIHYNIQHLATYDVTHV